MKTIRISIRQFADIAKQDFAIHSEFTAETVNDTATKEIVFSMIESMSRDLDEKIAKIERMLKTP